MCQRGTCLSSPLSSHIIHFPCSKFRPAILISPTDRQNRQYALVWREATVSLKWLPPLPLPGCSSLFSEAATCRRNRRLRLDCKRDSTAAIPSPE